MSRSPSPFDEDKHLLEEAKKYVDKGIYLWNRRKYDESIAECKKALSLRLSILGVYNEDTAVAYCWIGYSYFWKSELDKALTAFRTYLRIRRYLSGDANKPSIKETTYIQKILEKKGYNTKQYEQYNRHINVSIALEKRSFGTDNPVLALLFRKLALLASFEDQPNFDIDWDKADLINSKWLEAIKNSRSNGSFEYIRNGDHLYGELNYEKAIEKYYMASQAAKEPARSQAPMDPTKLALLSLLSKDSMKPPASVSQTPNDLASQSSAVETPKHQRRPSLASCGPVEDTKHQRRPSMASRAGKESTNSTRAAKESTNSVRTGEVEKTFSLIDSRGSPLMNGTHHGKEVEKSDRSIMDQCLLDLVERVEKIAGVLDNLSEKVTKMEQEGSKPDQVQMEISSNVKEMRGVLVSQFSALKTLSTNMPSKDDDNKIQLQMYEHVKAIEQLVKSNIELCNNANEKAARAASENQRDPNDSVENEERLMNLVGLVMKQQEIVRSEVMAENAESEQKDNLLPPNSSNVIVVLVAFLGGLLAKRNFLQASSDTNYFGFLRQPLLCLLVGILFSSIPAVREVFNDRVSSKGKSIPSKFRPVNSRS